MYSFVCNNIFYADLIIYIIVCFILYSLFDVLVHYSVIYISAYVRNGLNGDSTNIIEAKS